MGNATTDKERFVAFSFCWADILFELDAQHRVIFVSGATTLYPTLEAGHIIGKPFDQAFVATDAANIGQLMKLARKRGRISSSKLHIADRNGSPVPVRLSGYVITEFGEHFFVALKVGSEAVSAPDVSGRPDDDQMMSSDDFIKMATKKLAEGTGNEDLSVSLIYLPDLFKMQDQVGASSAQGFVDAVQTCLQANSAEGAGAAQISDGKYSLVHGKAVTSDNIEQQIKDIATTVLPADYTEEVVQATSLDLGDSEQFDQDVLTKGLMYTMSRFKDERGGDFSVKKMSQNMSGILSETMGSVMGFRDIVTDRAFDLALQPIISIKTGEIHHYEALCRFNIDDENTSPYERITFGEETGLIHEFDLAIVQKAREWLAKRPRNSASYNIAVNVSGYSIGVPAYVTALDKILAENDWLKGHLMFEITESSRMADLQAANSFIQHLRKKGYPVCLDDFGAGSASFQYLSALEVDVVKLDGSAVHNAQAAKKGRAFMSALTELCAKLGVETVAEMIDTEESLNFVRDCGCDFVQGYLFGKPSKQVKDFAPLPNLSLLKKTFR